MLAFVVGLKAEARLTGGAAYIGGGDAAGAARAAANAIADGAAALISFGLAGGLSPSMQPGAIVIPETVIWRNRHLPADARLGAALGGFSCRALLAADAVAVSAADKAAAWRASAADAVDLESGAVADAACAAGLPFGVLRAVCDPAWRDLPPAALAALDPSGQVGVGAVLRSVVGRPQQIGPLLRLASDAARARRALIGWMAALRRGGALDAWL